MFHETKVLMYLVKRTGNSMRVLVIAKQCTLIGYLKHEQNKCGSFCIIKSNLKLAQIIPLGNHTNTRKEGISTKWLT